MTLNSHRDFPVANGYPVTQWHTDMCAKLGHASWVKDGKDSGICPRCGEVTTAAEQNAESRLIAATAERPHPKAFDLNAAGGALVDLLEASRVLVAWWEPQSQDGRRDVVVRFVSGQHRTLALARIGDLRAMSAPISVTDLGDCTLLVTWA